MPDPKFDEMDRDFMREDDQPERCPHGLDEDEECEECGDLPHNPSIDR